jgi:peroxiredoxin
MQLGIGDEAPKFTLKTTDRTDVSLIDYKGRNVVILFFPAAFTGVCTAELCSVRDSIADYAQLDADVLAISVDLPFTLNKFKEEQGFQFPLLSDFNKEVSRAYGAIYEEWILGFKGVAQRSAFVVDREGKIRYAEVLENAGEQPDFEAVKTTLQSLS